MRIQNNRDSPPTGVKVPPMLEYMTMDIRIGTGFKPITSQSRMVTGVIRRTVVTLSRKEDITAVNKHRQLISAHTFPFVIYRDW